MKPPNCSLCGFYVILSPLLLKNVSSDQPTHKKKVHKYTLSIAFFFVLQINMSKNLRKKVVKQQSRLAALNLLGTPVGSEVEDNADSDTGDSLNSDSVIAHTDASTVEDDLRRCVDDLGEKRAR